MSNKLNIVITGASSGIGFELTKQLLDKGHTIYTISRKVDQLEQLKTNNTFDNLNIIKFDLNENDYSVIKDKLKGVTVNRLVNNAGLLINKPFLELSDNDFEKQYKVNVFAVMKLTQTLFPNMKAHKSAICNITSMGGINGSSKFPGLSGYSSSKGALSILTECLAEEFKEYGINVNALALGAVQTEMLEEAFPGYEANVSPVEMAAYISNFLLNDIKLFNGKIIRVSNSTP
jgi:short-subunit dehydrogenase